MCMLCQCLARLVQACCVAASLSGLDTPWCKIATLSVEIVRLPAGQQQHFEQQQQQQHGPLRSRSTTPRAGAQRAGNGRSPSPELADFLDAAAVALWHIPYLRERVTSLQVKCAFKALACVEDSWSVDLSWQQTGGKWWCHACQAVTSPCDPVGL